MLLVFNRIRCFYSLKSCQTIPLKRSSSHQIWQSALDISIYNPVSCTDLPTDSQVRNNPICLIALYGNIVTPDAIIFLLMMRQVLFELFVLFIF